MTTRFNLISPQPILLLRDNDVLRQFFPLAKLL